MNRNKKIAIIGGIILAIGIPIGIYQCLFSGPEKESEMERIVINLNTTEEELIPKLKEQGYIRSEWAFKFVLKRKGWEGKIEPGAYKVSKTMNVWTHLLGKVVVWLIIAHIAFSYQNKFGDHYSGHIMSRNFQNLNELEFIEGSIEELENEVS